MSNAKFFLVSLFFGFLISSFYFITLDIIKIERLLRIELYIKKSCQKNRSIPKLDQIQVKFEFFKDANGWKYGLNHSKNEVQIQYESHFPFPNLYKKSSKYVDYIPLYYPQALTIQCL